MDFYLLATFCFSVFTFLATPGPVTLLVIKNSATHLKQGVATIIGTNLASLVLIGVSYFIVRSVFAINPNYLAILQLIGSLYLLYFAIQIIRDARQQQHTETEHMIKPQKKLGQFFLQGFLIGISNPKDILFFTAFFPLFLGIHNNVDIGFMILTVTWVLLDYLILLGFGLFASKFVANQYANTIELVSGVILMLIALFALYYAITHLI